MAYGATVNIAQRSSAGHLFIEITETEVTSTSETSINLSSYGGQWWRVIRQQCSLTSGAGSTIDPILGRATNPAGVNIILENGTAAADVLNTSTADQTFCTATSAAPQNTTVYHRSRPDTGGNNAITTTYILQRVGT